jgi:hypothetical protein
MLYTVGILTVGALVFSISGGAGGDPVAVPPPTPP